MIDMCSNLGVQFPEQKNPLIKMFNILIRIGSLDCYRHQYTVLIVIDRESWERVRCSLRAAMLYT